jgi:hypothetical protein
VQVRSFAVVVGVGLASALAIAVLPGMSGCTFDNTNTVDSGYLPPPDDTGSDVVVADTAAPGPTVVDQVSGADIPADLSCFGKTDGGTGDAMVDETSYDGGTPSSGQLVPSAIDVYSFNQGSRRLAGAEIELFYGNTFKGVTADVTGIVTDDAGLATAPMPAGWKIAYRIVPRDNADLSLAYIPYYELDEPVPLVVGQKMHFFGMTKEVYGSLSLVIAKTSDYVIPADQGIVAMRIADCQRRYMRNVKVELLDVTAGVPLPAPLVDVKVCTTGTCLLYLSDLELPDPSRTITSRSGLITIVGLSAAKKYRIVAHADVDGAPNSTVAHRDLETVAGSIAVQYAQP